MKRIWSLEGRESSLQGHREDGLRRQLEKSVVLMSELLDEQRPAVFVKKLLVRRHLGGDWQCKQSHAVFHVGQLVVLESGEVLPRVPSYQNF